jgi:hypothetical protein
LSSAPGTTTCRSASVGLCLAKDSFSDPYTTFKVCPDPSVYAVSDDLAIHKIAFMRSDSGSKADPISSSFDWAKFYKIGE